jgi:hypothetical protein
MVHVKSMQCQLLAYNAESITCIKIACNACRHALNADSRNACGLQGRHADSIDCMLLAYRYPGLIILRKACLIQSCIYKASCSSNLCLIGWLCLRFPFTVSQKSSSSVGTLSTPKCSGLLCPQS